MADALAHDITCIDTGYVAEGVAAFYLVGSGDEFAIIESGTAHALPRLMQVLAEQGIAPEQVRYIIPTHVHLDHAGGVSAFASLCSEATVVAHPRAARHLIDPSKLVAGATAVYGEATFAKLYGTIEPVPEARVQVAGDGERLTFGDRTLEFRDTPGHARHHFCIYDERSKGWFTGDTFGLAYPAVTSADGTPFLVPTTTPVQFDPEALMGSIKLLMSYGPLTAYLTHYGAIDMRPDFAADLMESIDNYTRIALALADAPDRVVALEAALTDYTLLRLESRGVIDIANGLDKLAMDMKLNAQGLDSWLASRA